MNREPYTDADARAERKRKWGVVALACLTVVPTVLLLIELYQKVNR